MILTKTSTNYSVLDNSGDTSINGSVSMNQDGTINISINTSEGGYASYTKNAEGFVDFNSSFNEASNLIDYMQNLVEEILQELGQ